jgi:hypothetical protein
MVKGSTAGDGTDERICFDVEEDGALLGLNRR